MNYVGIDIGGTQLRVAIFDKARKVLDIYKTDNDHGLTCEQNVDKLIDFILKSQQYFPLAGIGIGCPGPLDLKKGMILNPPNLVGWDNFEIVKYVEGRTKLHVELNNDANVAGLAEALLGAGTGYESVVYMTVSTGLGGAYVYRNQLVNGAHTNAAEFWNMIVNEDPYGHKSANPGSLNEQVSGSGLTRIATERFGRPTSAKELFEKFYEKDPVAVDIVEKAANTLAKGIANVTYTIDPDIIVIGGSVAIFNSVFVKMALEEAKKYICFDGGTVKTAKAIFGDDAGLIGASLLIS